MYPTYVKTNSIMPIPVVYFAFSNDMDNPLSALKEESRKVYEALIPLENKRQIKIFRDEQATTDDIIRTLQRIADPANDFQLIAFHYGGHADGISIHLMDESGNASGLAHLLATFKQSLALVFLNGCSTWAQVDLLLKLGIRSVIATSAPINDKSATGFSQIFYQVLASRSTVKQAFDFATRSLTFKTNRLVQYFSCDVTRGLLLEDKAQVEMPWGLYYDLQATEILNFYLPFEEMAASASDDEVNINEYLLDIVFEMANFDQDIRREVEQDHIVEDELFAIMIRSFPWVISSQLQILKSAVPTMQKPTIDRLKQLVSVYMAGSQVMYFMSLSWLWHLKANKTIKKVDLSYEDCCEIEKHEFPTFDFVLNSRYILELISREQQRPFADEFESILTALQTENDFYQSYLYLQAKRELYFSGGFSRFEPAIKSVCLETEFHLSVFLKYLAFLIKYQMVSCRKVNISNVRHITTEYEHFISKLHANQDGINISKDPLMFKETILDSRSVLLLKDAIGTRQFLNLSPFIIDKNAFFDRNAYGNIKDNSTNVYVYAYMVKGKTETEDAYYFIKCGDNLLDWALQEDAYEVHKIHSNLVMKQRSKPLVKRFKREESEDLPLASIKDQFAQLKKDWINHE